MAYDTASATLELRQSVTHGARNGDSLDTLLADCLGDGDFRHFLSAETIRHVVTHQYGCLEATRKATSAPRPELSLDADGFVEGLRLVGYEGSWNHAGNRPEVAPLGTDQWVAFGGLLRDTIMEAIAKVADGRMGASRVEPWGIHLGARREARIVAAACARSIRYDAEGTLPYEAAAYYLACQPVGTIKRLIQIVNGMPIKLTVETAARIPPKVEADVLRALHDSPDWRQERRRVDGISRPVWVRYQGTMLATPPKANLNPVA